jgi:hypothetical protein
MLKALFNDKQMLYLRETSGKLSSLRQRLAALLHAEETNVFGKIRTSWKSS